MISELFDVASQLAWAGGEPSGSPVQLRRATSTAYYALFHAVARLCADQLVGLEKGWPLATPIYRSLEHRRARDTLTAMRKERPSSAITIVALAFATLQDARHEADYDPQPFRLTRRDVFDLIAAAQEAARLLDTMSADEKLATAVRLIARPR